MVNYLRVKAKTESIVTGEENLPKEGGYIMYANHQGKYDAIGLLTYHKDPCSVLIEIRSSRVFSTNEAVALLDGIRIDQKRPRQQVKCLRQLGEEAPVPTASPAHARDPSGATESRITPD